MRTAAYMCWCIAAGLGFYCMLLSVAWPPVPDGMWNVPITAALLAIGAGTIEK